MFLFFSYNFWRTACSSREKSREIFALQSWIKLLTLYFYNCSRQASVFDHVRFAVFTYVCRCYRTHAEYTSPVPAAELRAADNRSPLSTSIGWAALSTARSLLDHCRQWIDERGLEHCWHWWSSMQRAGQQCPYSLVYASLLWCS